MLGRRQASSALGRAESPGNYAPRTTRDLMTTRKLVLDTKPRSNMRTSRNPPLSRARAWNDVARHSARLNPITQDKGSSILATPARCARVWGDTPRRGPDRLFCEVCATRTCCGITPRREPGSCPCTARGAHQAVPRQDVIHCLHVEARRAPPVAIHSR